MSKLEHFCMAPKLRKRNRVIFLIFGAKFCSPEFRGSPRMMELNGCTSVQHDNLTNTPR